MKRYNFYFPQAMMNRFRELSVKTGVPMSEMLRRMIKEYLKRNKNREVQLDSVLSSDANVENPISACGNTKI
jgi:metal-responsive CopG/Arc/MetJ family transcriptional regulator